MKKFSPAVLVLLASSTSFAASSSYQIQVLPTGLEPAANIVITPIEAKAYMMAGNSGRVGCGSTDLGLDDHLNVTNTRRANGKEVPAKVTKEGDHFVVTVDTSDEGGRCGWVLSEADAKVHVTAQATASGPALDSDLYWDLSFNGNGTPYPKVLCARPIEKNYTNNVGNIPPGGTITSQTTREDGSVWYNYTAMLPNLWCSTNAEAGSANGRAEVPVNSSSQISIKIDLTPGAVRMP